MWKSRSMTQLPNSSHILQNDLEKNSQWLFSWVCPFDEAAKAFLQPLDQFCGSSLNVKEIRGGRISREYFNQIKWEREILATVSTYEIYMYRVYLVIRILTRSQCGSLSGKMTFLKFVCWSWTALKEDEKVANKFSILLRDSANTE